VDRAQQDYFESRRTNTNANFYLDQSKKAEQEWREYMGKVGKFLPQFDNQKLEKIA
jgi:hypothetical protein